MANDVLRELPPHLRDTFEVVNLRLQVVENRVSRLETSGSLQNILPDKMPWLALVTMLAAVKVGLLGAISPGTLEKLLLLMFGIR